MSDMQRLEPCEVCGAIATDQVITDRGMRYYCLRHLPANVRLATDAKGAAVSEPELIPLQQIEITELRTALAAATQRAEQAEAKLAAVPVEALRRYMRYQLDHHYGVYYSNLLENADVAAIRAWLAQQSEVQP